ncbi:MAG: signal peptidase II [Erysipelotrichaceae bacterium]|nr:signal peptidase II [Erysipelotrichaceae bacterium]MDD4642518.1 signal peptidase II [Erysipelotrichaceae bacterium]
MKKREVVILGIILLIDLISKYYIQSIMTLGDSIEVIKDFFYITYVHNTGAAWGILSGKLEIFFVITIVVIVLIMYIIFTTDHNKKLLRLALIVILAGTLGNFFDRVVFGYVRDFLNFYPFGYDFPVFNIADTALTIGYILLAWFVIRNEEEA